MMHRLLFVFLVSFAVAPFAISAAPDSLDGRIYHETSTFVVSVRNGSSFGRLLRADGTYQGIYYAGQPDQTFVDPPPDGRWSYRKTDENTAELIFDDASQLRRLTFSSAENGSISGPFASGRFYLVGDLSTRPPLLNCSNRSLIAVGGMATTGFVVSQSVTIVLVRAAGPALAQFGVQSPVAAPALEIFSGQSVLERNTGWGTNRVQETLRRTANYVGAFPFPQNSSDSAVILSLNPGAYTARATSAVAGGSGEVLIEVYVVR